MTRPAARLNDKTLGNCEVHGPNIKGRIITASSNIIVNGRPLARHGDKVKADCGHIAEIITEIGRVNPNQDIGTARLNDRVGKSPYKAVIITASPNVKTGNS